MASYVFGRYRVNVESLELLKDGQPLPISPKAFDALVLLLTNRHRVVGKEEMFKEVWREAFVSDDSLTQCISSLRRTLGDDPNEPGYVATVPRRGYRFIAPVMELAPEGSAVSTAPIAPPPAADAAPHPPLAGEPPSMAAPLPGNPSRLWRGLAFLLVGLICGGVAGVAVSSARRELPRALQLNLQPPFGTTLTSGAVLSPDGSMAAFVAEDSGNGRRLWVVPLDGGEARPLPGTQGAAQPFWSPDSRSLAYFAGGFMRRFSLPAGPSQTIVPVGAIPAGASWGGDTIIFAAFRAHLNAVKDSGGPVEPVTRVEVDAGDRAHEWPRFLPGGDGRFLFTVDSSDPARAGTYLASLGGGPPRRVLPDPYGTYASPGYLLYVRDRTLMAQRFNLERETLEGTPLPMAGDVTAPTLRNDASISSAPGLLAFGGGMVGGHLVWLDRAGQQVAVTHASDLHSPALLPGRNQVLVEGSGAVWLVDLDRKTTTRLMNDASTPVPSPDGRQVLFNAVRGGVNDLFVTDVGSDRHELLLATAENKLPNDWTRDGRYVVFASRNPQTARDLWLLPLQGDRTPVPFSLEEGNQIQAQVSPDGTWIAYASDESGTWQVYVQAFPGGGRKQVVSPGGGAKPQWRADGRELYYLAPDRMLMAAPVSPSGEIGPPGALFQTPVVADLSTYRSQFVPDADGQRFLFDASDPASAREPVTLLVNWLERLNR